MVTMETNSPNQPFRSVSSQEAVDAIPCQGEAHQKPGPQHERNPASLQQVLPRNNDYLLHNSVQSTFEKQRNIKNNITISTHKLTQHNP
ncbi:unnamed protein product [Bursaphelenchus okinawaensis]|uniref:Uncharacterized protein n=1 Tax=Bursaphelenchus okinawaensis TaxID=465554 RepID=A0A811LAK5_9BILA|nr:unnamed protein product [Bursaphelenchus okinawaensis]CAG9119740.1 unnamed protein product [Bursaphelenchus okinawaensis]